MNLIFLLYIRNTMGASPQTKFPRLCHSKENFLNIHILIRPSEFPELFTNLRRDLRSCISHTDYTGRPPLDVKNLLVLSIILLRVRFRYPPQGAPKPENQERFLTPNLAPHDKALVSVDYSISSHGDLFLDSSYSRRQILRTISNLSSPRRWA